MIAPHREREFKLRARAPLAPSAVDALLARTGVDCRRTLESAHTDVYLDDDQRSLARHRIGLRLRRGSLGAVLCLKTAGERRGALAVREELEMPWPDQLPPANAAGLPIELRDRIEPYVLDRPLLPQVTLQVQRSHRELARGEACLGELTLDAVAATAGGKQATFTEVELEVHGDLGACEELIDDLRAELPLAVAPDDKLAHALRLLDEAPEGSGTGDGTIGALLAARWTDLLAQLRAAEASVRSTDDPEAVHRLRVCLRRLRVLARAFRSVFGVTAARETLDAMQRASHAAGALRERDVLIGLLPAALQQLPAALAEAGGGGELIAQLGHEREIARDAVRALLRDAAHAKDLELLEALGQCSTMRAGSRDRPARETVARAIRKAARKLRQRLRRLDVDASLADLHAARIAAKRLRYLLEEVGGAGLRVRERDLRRLVRIQTGIGEVCDQEGTAKRFLSLLAAADPSRSKHRFALLGALAAAHHEAAVAARPAAQRVGRKVDRRRFWRRY